MISDSGHHPLPGRGPTIHSPDGRLPEARRASSWFKAYASSFRLLLVGQCRVCLGRAESCIRNSGLLLAHIELLL